MSLNGDGQWQLATDPQNVGREEAWWNGPRQEARATRVPWIIQDAFPEYHGVAWYWRDFSAPDHPQRQGRALLRFEAVDYSCEVWLNGTSVGGHEGGEGPFTLDVTDAIRLGANGPNRLAVRVLNPGHEPIDGVTLGETPHRCKCIPFVAGAAFNHGGITGPVHLVLAPPARVQDLWVRAEAPSGILRVQASIRSELVQSARAEVELSVALSPNGSVLCRKYLRCDIAPGDSVIEAELQIDSPQLWQLNEPSLYRVSCRLEVEDVGGGSAWADECSTRCGFRDFRFERGYFRLNGRRLFLRGTHTLNHTPVGLQVPHDPDLLRRDLLNLKVMGFNLVRFIWGGAVPYQLDLCDEIGLLVYNESYAAFPFAETPRMAERFDRSISEIVRRDRNHPSVVIWGLLNEVHDNSLFRHAAASLPLLHALDGTRMAMLNSGRWDKDLSLGSFSNPGSLSWDVMLGREGEAVPTPDGTTPLTPLTLPSPAAHGDQIAHGEGIEAQDPAALLGVEPTMQDAPETQAEVETEAEDAPASNLSHGHEPQPPGEDGGFGTDWATIPGYVMDMGDVHPYPRVPQLPVATEILRCLGHNSRRVYLSEYGIGSAVDLWRATRHFERLGATHAEDAAFYRDKLSRFERDWRQWKLDEIFVAPPEFFARSLAKMAGQRTLGLNAIRANPNLAGYSLTGAIDHVMCGEGLTTLFRELKPGTTDALFEGLAPLRLCLFAEPPHIYRHGSLRLEAVLANEDALPAGDYRVQLQVVGPGMERVFERTVTVTVPERGGEGGQEEAPLAIPFFDERISIGGEPGQYRFVAFLEEGGAATGGEGSFFVTDADAMPDVPGEVVLWGQDDALSRWLAEHNISARPFSSEEECEEEADARQVLVVSRAAAGAGGIEEWRDLTRRIARGATAIFLSPQVFARGDDALFWLPLENKGEPTSIRGWLYLKDEWAKRHPIFDGLPSGGLLDYAFYRELIPDALYSGQDAPQEAVAGAIKASQDYASGLMLAVHELGAGRVILSTMRILESLGAHPAAERLLRNLLRFATRDADLPLAQLPADFDQSLARLYQPQTMSPFKQRWQAAIARSDEPHIAQVALPQEPLQWRELHADENQFVNFFALDGQRGGLVYARGEIEVPTVMTADLLLGPDGPCKVWIGEQAVGVIESAHNPGRHDKQSFSIALKAGRHLVTVALNRRGGLAWGFFLRFRRTDGSYSAQELRDAQALLPIVDP